MLGTHPNAVFAALFLITWLLRYVRLIVNIVAFATFKPRNVPKHPIYTPDDVTVLMPTTFSNPEEVMKSLKRIASCGPFAMIVITSNSKIQSVISHCAAAGLSNIQVLGVSILNKRRQMLKGLEYVETDITFFVDDDVYYPSTNMIQHLLNCFEDSKVGAAGPRMRGHRNVKPSMWNFLGISYLERRNFNTGATNHIDGGISTLSGRTQAIRTEILRNTEFYHYFRNDSFMGHKLTVDDDKALTRFIFSHGWEITLNFHEECTLETTTEEGHKFLDQCIRWGRGHWRGNMIVMAKEKYWYAKHVWTLFAIYICQFQTPALLVDGVLFFLLGKAVTPCTSNVKVAAMVSFAVWVVFTKLVKVIPHFLRYPQDLVFVPVSIAFSYLHGFINLYALFTTHKTIWGSKASVDTVAEEDCHFPLLPAFALRPENLLNHPKIDMDVSFIDESDSVADDSVAGAEEDQ